MTRSAFVPAALLAVVCVGAKAFYAAPPASLSAAAQWLDRGASDVAFCAGFGVLSGAALWASARRPRLHRALWRIVLGLGAVLAFYAVVNVGVYRALHQSLNMRVLRLAHRVAEVRSSVEDRLSVALVASLVVVPLAYAIVAVRWAPSRVVKRTLALVAAGWIVAGVAMRSPCDPDEWFARATKSPHFEMLSSLAADLFVDPRIEMADDFSSEDLLDFRPAATRRPPPLGIPAPRNVIVVVLESVSAKYLSLHGAAHDTTPNLVAEARHALVFDRFYAHVGYTFCEMMPIVYSIYPGLPWRWEPSKWRPTMPPGLASVLRERGWRTAFLSAGEPQWAGMDVMAQRAGMTDVIGPTELRGPVASSWGTEDGVLVDGLIRWIDADLSRPFFALVWTDQTHDPYTLSNDTQPVRFPQAKGPHREAFERYLNAIRQADRHLGRLFAALRERGLAEDTLVVVTGDHGEAFADLHDVVGHGGGLYEENLHVPLMLWNPRAFPAGRRIERAGGHVDLNPTLAHLLGIAPPSTLWQGASLLDDAHPGRVYLLADRCGVEFGVCDGRYKAILRMDEGVERLFDLRDDPDEQHDLSKERRDVADRMRRRVAAFLHAAEQQLIGADPLGKD